MIDEGVLLTAVVVPCVGALVYAIHSTRTFATRGRKFNDNDMAVIDARVLMECEKMLKVQREIVLPLTRNDHRRAIEVLDEAEAEVKSQARALAERLARR
jgi:hypothetical protein